MNIVVPMAGASEAFKNYGIYPKNFIEVAGKPLFQHMYENIKNITDARFIFIITKEEAEKFHLDDILYLLCENSEVIILENETEGAVCSILLAIDYINNDTPLIIANGDQVINMDFNVFIDNAYSKKLDGAIVTFESIHPRWSYVRVDQNGKVIETSEKRPISKSATAGFYYFSTGARFVEAAMEMMRKDARVNGKFYVCPVYNEMILKQANIEGYSIERDAYFSFSTPQGVQVFESFLKGERCCEA